MKKIVNILVCFCCVTLLAKLPAVSCLYAQTRSDREINAIKIPKKDSTGRIVLPHKILPASVSTVKTPKDSLSITKRLISHTIKHLENGQSAQALYTIHEALSNCPKEEIRTKAIAIAYYAMIQIKTGCHTKSVNSLNTCDSLFRNLGDIYLLAFHYNNLGLFYQKFHSQEKADKYFLRALAFGRAIEDNSHITATALNNLAIGDGDSKLKISYLNEAIAINQKEGRKLSLAENYNNLAYQYIVLGKYKIGHTYLDSALTIGKSLNAQEILFNNYDLRSIIYAKEGNYRLAYEETKKRQQAQKIISDGQNISDIEEMISNRILSRKEYEINLQKKENDIKRLNLTLVILISAFIITILVFLYIYFFISNRRRMQNLELKQASAERDVKYTQAELLNLATYINSRNDILCNIQESLSKAQKMEAKDVYSELRRMNLYIRNLQTKNEDVESVMSRIGKINKDFIDRLTSAHPDLTKNDKNVALLLRAGLSTKQISTLMDCSPKSVNMARYRMRQHLNIDSDTNLTSYLKSF